MLGVLLAGALEAVDLARQRLAHRLGERRASSMRARYSLDDVVVAVLAQLLADRVELLAQQELALLSSPCRR